MYADSTAVLGPLSRTSEPHTYDLCGEHSAGLTVPRGWRAIRVAGTDEASDDLVAIADAVGRRPRPAGPVPVPPQPAPRRRAPEEPSSAAPARHLHVVRSPDE